ncbi:hypothetical protein L0Y46_02305 [bacterium]|nr:hypothetical protein [bacterium]MCI0680342.1 hypothetical protein [bacterium]
METNRGGKAAAISLAIAVILIVALFAGLVSARRDLKETKKHTEELETALSNMERELSVTEETVRLIKKELADERKKGVSIILPISPPLQTETAAVATGTPTATSP